ncbi:glycosyl transferase group 1 protein [Alistipes sp. CAG:268]|jgi:glycosyltransferase involved in cell wall biosynthesis|uniref:glycosyltransferase n=1 Tax=Alistipes sp. CAG:268 TaxID=1262693 RepID=UPI00033FA780|nr:glycosyltransferase [Alistipes sp. CAG:268]CDC98113.1 glycosyl transferase group 1 protein [Alistipes sp. CAG:268]
MRLYFICEYRFVRCPDGRIYSPDGVFGPRLFGRYLRIFDRVTVVARVAATSVPCDPALCCESRHVDFLPLPDCRGIGGYLRGRRMLRAHLREALDPGAAYICRVPGELGTMMAAELRRHELPYAVEVVGDPWDVFASGECYGGLRPLIRLRAWWQLRRTVRFASEALYVTGRTLQRRYPSSGRMFGISDVDLPPERIAAAPARYPVGRPVRLLSVGALDRMYKSPDVVLHAVALVGASGTRCSLRWIGGGQHLAAMERYAARLGIADRVRFEGQQPADRVADELRRADLFVLASRTEGLPRALIEAMAAGLPCIGTRVGGIPELLDDEALVAPGDAEALAARIRAFLDDAGLFERQAARNLREASIYAAPRLQRLRDGFLQTVAMNTRH